MNQSEIILYKTEDGAVKIDTIFQNETLWLTQKKMAEERYDELDEKVAVRKFRITTQHV